MIVKLGDELEVGRARYEGHGFCCSRNSFAVIESALDIRSSARPVTHNSMGTPEDITSYHLIAVFVVLRLLKSLKFGTGDAEVMFQTNPLRNYHGGSLLSLRSFLVSCGSSMQFSCRV